MAESFLSGAAPVRFTAAGNCLRKVSPLVVAAVRFMAAGNCLRKFPTRCGSSAVHGGRKLLAEVSYSLWQQCGSWRQETACGSFLLAVVAVRFIAAGNCLRKVSPLAVAAVRFIAAGNCLRKFPTRRGSSAVHSGRKLISTKIPAHGRAGIGDDYFTSWIMGRIMGRRLVRS